MIKKKIKMGVQGEEGIPICCCKKTCTNIFPVKSQTDPSSSTVHILLIYNPFFVAVDEKIVLSTQSCHYSRTKGNHHKSFIHCPLVAKDELNSFYSHSATLADDVSKPDLSQQMWHNTCSQRNVSERTKYLSMKVTLGKSVHEVCAD